MSPPNLLHIFPSFGSGGAQLLTASIINALGHEFAHRIMAIDGDLGASAAIDSAIHVEFCPAPSHARPFTAPSAFRRTVQELRPALVLTYNWGAIEAVMGARMAGCTVIHNECGFGADEAVKLKRRRIWTRRLVLNTIFRTVATSANMLRIARRQFGLSARKAQLIRTGVDVVRFRPGRNTPGRISLGVSEQTVLFGYIGGLRPEKNLPLMMRAFGDAQIPNAKLILVGDGPCRRSLEDLVRELCIADAVIFAGHVMDPLPYLLMLDVFVMSSSTEQLPNALLEAMACGLPVVCTDVGDSRETLGAAAEGCVVRPGDLDDFVQALRAMANNSDRRTSLGAANRKLSATHYCKENMVREYAALFHAALDHR